MDDPGILPGRQVRLRSDPAGKQIPGGPASNVSKPRLDRVSGLLGDLELHRTSRLLLNDARAITDPTADADILDLQPHEIATPKFAVDREVEQGLVAGSALHLESDPDRPHVPRLQRALLPDIVEKVLEQNSRGIFCRRLVHLSTNNSHMLRRSNNYFTKLAILGEIPTFSTISPNKAPFVPGIATRHRRLVAIEHDRLLGTDRALPAPVRPRPAGHSMPGARFVIETYPSSVGGPTGSTPRRIGSLLVADRDHEYPPLLQNPSGRGLSRSAMIAPRWCRSSAALVRVCLLCRRSLLTGPTAAAQPYRRERVFMPRN